jgi:hypothetical protein
MKDRKCYDDEFITVVDRIDKQKVGRGVGSP